MKTNRIGMMLVLFMTMKAAHVLAMAQIPKDAKIDVTPGGASLETVQTDLCANLVDAFQKSVSHIPVTPNVRNTCNLIKTVDITFVVQFDLAGAGVTPPTVYGDGPAVSFNYDCQASANIECNLLADYSLRCLYLIENFHYETRACVWGDHGCHERENGKIVYTGIPQTAELIRNNFLNATVNVLNKYY